MSCFASWQQDNSKLHTVKPVSHSERDVMLWNDRKQNYYLNNPLLIIIKRNKIRRPQPLSLGFHKNKPAGRDDRT